MGGSCCAPESFALQRIGMISHRVGDFVLCKATLENNLIGAMQQYTGLSSSVTQNPVRQGKKKGKSTSGTVQHFIIRSTEREITVAWQP